MEAISRRDFLKLTGQAASALAVTSLLGISATEQSAQAQGIGATPLQSASDILSLPKGGGAIYGIGETFRVQAFMGTANFSVPIATSPGRSGFGPQLSLQYSSGQGNGPFGLGWALSVPNVTRKTEKGLPDYSDTDTFLLSGAEDLAEHTDRPARDEGQFHVTIYRPRVEGLFARIEKWERREGAATLGFSDSFWRITTRDNVTSIYGRTLQAVLANPQAPGKVFQWLLELTYDAKGNYIRYDYKAEDETGLPQVIFEQNHTHHQVYLKRIRYGNLTPWTPSGPNAIDQILAILPEEREHFFLVVFDYGEHGVDEDGNDVITADIYTETKPWIARADPFSTYRAGFEIRTHRRCKRVLMFHTGIPGEVGPVLVKSTDFRFQENPDTGHSMLAGVTQRGYRKATSPGSFLSEEIELGQSGAVSDVYQIGSLPPLTFGYTEFEPKEQRYQPFQALGGDMPPYSLKDPNFVLVDLFGTGLPDVLQTTPSGYYVWRNLGNGLFDRRQTLVEQPVGITLDQPGVGFGDMAGDGRADLLVHQGQYWGFYEATGQGGWNTFHRYGSFPSFALNDPNVRLLDLTGNGKTDVLRTDEHQFTYIPCLGEEGFGLPEAIRRVYDMDLFPDVYFADPSRRVRLADMSGDGLQDIVLVHSSRIDYWPNLGYGRFGQRITMQQAPSFGYDFDPARLFLVDIDGDGAADVVYVEASRVSFWFNRSGNGWSEKHTIEGTPMVTDMDAVQFADMLGNGSTGILWSRDYQRPDQSNYLFLDFTGGVKPYVLTEMSNYMGSTTRVYYATSTQEYLEDLKTGHPWLTPLPFPVQVLKKVEVTDHIARSRLVTTYTYHQGYYDGWEREFRGFGRVDQQDAEAFEDYVVGIGHFEGRQALDPELYQPPVTTRTWFHTGAFLDPGLILHQLREEYYRQEQHTLEPSLPEGLNEQESRECLRSLKGLPLRQELYSFDGSAKERHPYSVVENNYQVDLLQRLGNQNYAVFFVHGSETIANYYERNPADPRVAHNLNMEVDQYGNVLKACSVVYGRKNPDPSLPLEVNRDQQKTYITYSETDYTPDIDQEDRTPAYRLGAPYESRTYEITGIAPASGLFGLTEIKGMIASTNDIHYEAIADGVTPQRRPLSQSRSLFLDNSLNPLPLGKSDTLGLGYQSYQLALTPGIAEAHYASKVTEADFYAAGYVHFEGDANWWIPSGTAIYPANPADHFFIPTGNKDPLGTEKIFAFDQFDLLVERVQVKQEAWDVVIATNDYRVLGPTMITNSNKNRSGVEMDALGMVVKSAVMGKDGAGEGDTLDDPTVRMEYELFNWMKCGKPNLVHTFAREKHGAANPRWQESYAYFNGSGGVAIVKAQANKGKALLVNPDGRLVEVDADPRWVGNGRTILNNKGNPVKRYEPYFSTTYEYEDEDALREIGVTPILSYDALGRNVHTLFPNGTFSKVEFDPWMQKVFDTNDTVKESQWYADRDSPDPATQPIHVNDPEYRAAWLAAKHADTPSIIHFDSLGRSVYTVSDFGSGNRAAVRTESDLTGRFSRTFDQGQREVASQFTDMGGTSIYSESAEKGQLWTFLNVLGALAKSWNEHGREFRTEYDSLHRPVSTFVRESGQAEILSNYVVYGDRHPDAQQLNLLGVSHLNFDQAGMARVLEVDFQGNSKRVERVLAKEYKSNLDWSEVAEQTDYKAIQTTADPALEVDEVFVASSLYDALNRPTFVTLPDGTVMVPTYNEANFLASLRVQIRGRGDFIEFLKDQDYDAKGQRQFAHYGNEVFTRYLYDPQNFRLTNMLTYRSDDPSNTEGLQNLHFTYDPAGNITQILDEAQQTQFFNNAVVKSENLFEYDAIYQLIRATGREHAGLANDTFHNHKDLGFVPQLPHATNAAAVCSYTEEYEYDPLGNIKKLGHHFKTLTGACNGWTQRYRYAYEADPTDRTNRLRSTTLAANSYAEPYSADYQYDAYGNMIRMPHLANLNYNFMDHLTQVDLGGGGTAYYVYGADGQRIRKVIERQGSTHTERIYLGVVEIYREWQGNNAPHLERQTLHISDNTSRIAQVDTKIRDDNNSDSANPLNTPLIRYQHRNHLGSAILETNADGDAISYEEYHPYGTSAYRYTKRGFDLSLKRYRYSGKERDDETGMVYFGARYYAAWLGRWTSSDPAGFIDGPNQFKYCRNNPVNLRDQDGLDDVPQVDLTSSYAGPNYSGSFSSEVNYSGSFGSEVNYSGSYTANPNYGASPGAEFNSYSYLEISPEPLSLGDFALKVDFEGLVSPGDFSSDSLLGTQTSDVADTLAPDYLALSLPTMGNGMPVMVPGESLNREAQYTFGMSDGMKAGLETAAWILDPAGSVDRKYFDGIPVAQIALMLALSFRPTTGPLQTGLLAETRIPNTVELNMAFSEHLQANNLKLANDLSLVQKYLTPAEYLEGLLKPARAYGTALERMQAESIAADSFAGPFFRYKGGPSNPDWVGSGPLQGLNFDVTTVRSAQSHYIRPYGENLVVHTYARPPWVGF